MKTSMILRSGVGFRFLLPVAMALCGACTEDETQTGRSRDIIRFEVCEAGPVGSPSAVQSRESSSGEAQAALSPAPRVSVLRGEGAADTLFVHTTVREGIESSCADDTRATPVTDMAAAGSFGVFAYAYAGAWSEALVPDYMYNVEVREQGGAWSPASAYYWPGGGKKIRFYAYAPYNGAGLTLPTVSTAGAPKITYTVPADVSEQQDLLAASSGELSGDPGTAVPLAFSHLLTAVKFVAGDDMVAGTVRSISLKGVYGSGTYVLGGTSWSEYGAVKNFSQTLGKTLAGTAGEEITTAAQTFMMLPQTLPAGASIEVVINDGSTDHTLTADIAGTTWTKGTTVTYRVSTTSISVVGVLTVVAPDDFTYAGGTKAYQITSYVTDKAGSKKEARAWTAEFSTDDGATWSATRPAWLTAFTAAGTGATAAQSFNAKVAAQTASTTTATPHTDALRAAAPVSDYDLSLYDIYGQAQPGMTTANCYVVHAPGTYRLPLVYGNAVRNGATNTSAYQSTTSGEHQLSVFLRHDDQPITAPCIADNGIVPDNAVLLWNDANKDFITVKPTLETHTATIDGAAKSVQYIAFTIPQASIQQGNALIAVRDASNTILWSWHIWVTDDALTPIAVTNYVDQTNRMMPVNLGWCDTQSTTTSSYAGRTCQVRITQEGTNKSEILTVRQPAAVIQSANEGNSPYYQWGRKEPFLGRGQKIAVAQYQNKTAYDNTGVITNAAFSCLTVANSSASIGRTIREPTVFYYDSKTYAPINKFYFNLWNINFTTPVDSPDKVVDPVVIKTVYDPCPPGFHLPPSNAFSGFSTTGKSASKAGDLNVNGPYDGGWNFYCGKNQMGGTIFFPEMGYRSSSFSIGKLSMGNGIYWLAGVSNYYYPHYLYFNKTTLHPLTQSDAAAGCSVRPVQE